MDDKVEISVEPTFLSDSHPLASVHNEYNAVYVCGEAVGETMFYGPGAGSLPTATSIVSDLVAVMKNMQYGVNGKSIISPQYPKKLKEPDEMFSKHFLDYMFQMKLVFLQRLPLSLLNIILVLKKFFNCRL